MPTANDATAVRRLLRYIVSLWRRDFHGELLVSFHGPRGVGQIKVTEGMLPQNLPASSVGEGDNRAIEEAIRG
jgi:hypothetical protein